MFHVRRILCQHSVLGFFTLALALSWLLEIPLALRAQGVLGIPVPYGVHYLAAFGPMASALLVTSIVGGLAGLHALLESGLRWRIGIRWLVVSIGSPVALFVVASLLVRLIEGTWPDLGRLGEVNFLENIGAVGALILWVATFGFGEETGWRGFALPRLQQGRSALGATAILAAGWGLWHVPTFFYLPTYLKLGLAGVPGFALGLLFGAILLTWLYNSTGASLFAVAMWHGLYDFFSASHATDPTMNAIMSMAVMVWVIAILVLTRPGTLSRSKAEATS